METNKSQMLKTNKQLFYYLVNIAEMYPQYTLAQHFIHIMRKKDDNQDPYFWSQEKLLSKVESYYDELNDELLTLKN
jgi:hypothetical protein